MLDFKYTERLSHTCRFDLIIYFLPRFTLWVIYGCSIALFSGCISSDNNAGLNLHYGMNESEVTKVISRSPSPVFIFCDLDGCLFKCNSYYLETNYTNYYFLYKDDILISIVPEDEIKNKIISDAENVEINAPHPYHDGYSNLKRLFIPPTPLSQIDFDKVNVEVKKNKESARQNGIIMFTMLSPFIIGLSPLWLPSAGYDIWKSDRIWEKIEKSRKLGLSLAEVKDILGNSEYEIIGNENYFIMYVFSYKESHDSSRSYTVSTFYGFRNNKLELIIRH